MNTEIHIPVLLHEVIAFFNPRPGQVYIDATANGGGHALALAERIRPDGRLLALEWDTSIYQQLLQKIQVHGFGQELIAVHGSYTELKTLAKQSGFEAVDGVLFDLGMSSFHIEQSGRGFSFQKDEPLDMRFDPEGNEETAAAIVNAYSQSDLVKLFREYGEERFAWSIAQKIVEVRKQERIVTTGQLVAIIKSAVPARYQHQHVHYATRVFQALRIAVNHELENLAAGLQQASQILKIGGKLCVISFHSLEDRIVKNFYRDSQRQHLLKIITKKPVTAGEDELQHNPRSRSAKLRVAEKL